MLFVDDIYELQCRLKVVEKRRRVYEWHMYILINRLQKKGGSLFNLYVIFMFVFIRMYVYARLFRDWLKSSF